MNERDRARWDARLHELEDELRGIAARGLPGEQRAFDDGLAEVDELREKIRKYDELQRHAANPAHHEPTTPGLWKQGPADPWRADGEIRDRARWAAERMTWTAEPVRDKLVRLVDEEADRPHSPAATWALATSDPHYRSAFAKLLRDPVNGHRRFDDRELAAFQRAEDVRSLAVGTNTQGGFLVPTHLDPAIMLTSTGSTNVLRRIARTVTLTAGNVWNGVTSAGVTASWDAELAEVSDDSPAVDRASIPVYTARAFVAASLEAFEDSDIDAQVAALFADAKDRLEGTAFMTGSGSGQPTGIFTALDANTNVELVSTTAATIGLVDLNTTYYNVPARWKPRARWLMNPLYALAIKDLGAAVSASFTATLADPPTEYLHGKPVVTSDDAPATQTTTVRDNEIIFGDFSNFVIVDRVGATVEFIPHVFGTNGRPVGARGWFMHWRSGSDSVVDQAFRLMQDRTSS
jgi:HK97 family phage major capsid protein